MLWHMLSIWYHSHQSLLLALYLQQEWGASRPKKSSHRAYRKNSLLFCASLCSAINSLAPHVHKCKNQNVCSKKKHMSYINLHQMFKVYIPTINLLWTCLNTHYLYLSKVIPSNHRLQLRYHISSKKAQLPIISAAAEETICSFGKKSTTISGASIHM